MSHFEINPMNRLYHINNIEVIADGMEKQLDAFAEKNPDKPGIVQEKKEQLIALKETQVFISKLYSQVEKLTYQNLSLKIEKSKLEQGVELLKTHIEKQEEMYNGLLEFDKQ